MLRIAQKVQRCWQLSGQSILPAKVLGSIPGRHIKLLFSSFGALCILAKLLRNYELSKFRFEFFFQDFLIKIDFFSSDLPGLQLSIFTTPFYNVLQFTPSPSPRKKWNLSFETSDEEDILVCKICHKELLRSQIVSHLKESHYLTYLMDADTTSDSDTEIENPTKQIHQTSVV